MATATQNMTPVYDGVGNLMGYAMLPSQIKYAIISNGTITMFNQNDEQVGSGPFNSDVAANLRFSPAQRITSNVSGTVPIISTGIPTGGVMPPIQTGTGYSDIMATGTPQTGELGGDVFVQNGGDVPTVRDLPCDEYVYTVSNVRQITGSPVQIDIPNTGNDIVPQSITSQSIPQCILVADVFECCIKNGLSTISNPIATIVLARAKFAITVEPCPDGGSKAVIRQYFDLSDIRTANFQILATFGGRTNTTLFRQAFRNSVGFVNLDSGILSPIWGRCDGTRQTFIGDYLEELGRKNPGSALDGNSYVNFFQTTYPIYQLDQNSVTYNGYILGTPCSVEGRCIVPPQKPGRDPDRPTTTEECYIVSSLEEARRLNGQYGTVFVDVDALISLTRTKTSGQTVYTKTDRVNLASQGFPCETGIFETATTPITESYAEHKVCYTITPTGGVLNVTWQQTGNRFTEPDTLTYSSVTYTTIGPTLIQDSRQYDPNAGCCENLTWENNRNGGPPPTPTDRINTGRRLNGNATRGGIGGNMAGMPAQNTSYLNHNLSDIKYGVRIDTCGCDEVDIADIWCYYNNVPVKVWASASATDPRTYVSPVRAIPDINCVDARVFFPFDRKRDVSLSVKKDKTAGLFDGAATLSCYITSSVTSSTSNFYYYDVHDCIDCTKNPYFAVSYGHFYGSGSTVVNSDQNNVKTYTDAVYSQYQLMCNETEKLETGGKTLPKFSFVSQSATVESDDIYVINFYREGLIDKLDPGNFEINVAYLSGSFYANAVHTGSNVKVGSSGVLRLIDNSDDFSQQHLCNEDPLFNYDIISGSLQNGPYEAATVNSYGKVYPSLGVIVLHPKRLNEIAGFNTVTGSRIAGDNAYKLFTAISGAASPTVGRTDTYPMYARNVKYKTTHHYSIRVYKDQANYTNNPTYVSGSFNTLFDTCFIKQPTTYITSIGLYNENHDLIAVAKLTKPLKKDFDSDLLVKIRLNW